MKSRFILKGLDLTALLKDELRKEKTKLQQSRAMLFFYISRFLDSHGIEPAVVIHLYENHSWEKSFRHGLKSHLPGTKVIGYLHVPFSPGYLSLFLSCRELRRSETPDRIVTIGPKWKTLLLQHGYPNNNLEVGPALRFSHIFNREESNRSRKCSESTRTSTVLVAGSIAYGDSFELVYKAIEALRDTTGIDVLIKFHPKMTGSERELIRSILDNLGTNSLPSQFSTTGRSIPELLPSIDLLLYNETSVSYEALAWGIPVLFVQSDVWFDINPIPQDSEIAVVARRPEEIKQAVRQLLSEDELVARQRRLKMQDLLKEAFCPIREETMSVFLTGISEDVG